MRAAEKLFATRGVSVVSLREISAAAGQRNVSAAIYHFGTKTELVESVLERHSKSIQDDWLQKLAHYDASTSLREIVELFVLPIIAKMDDVDGGRQYLSICAQLTTNLEFPLVERRVSTAPGAAAISQRIASLAGQSRPQLLTLHMMRVVTVLYTGIADYLRVQSAGIAIPRDVFERDMVDAITSVIEQRTEEVADSQLRAAAR